jgi:O-acetyl-ADP-ribose deacetylase (regulator of RNase III)
VSEAKITGCGTMFTVVHGGVVGFTGSAIVNAANTKCLGGGGIDGFINQVGGTSLHKARMALPVINSYGDRCDTGDAKVTTAGLLPNNYVIHAVGPVFSVLPNDYNREYELLANAYKNALLRAQERNLKSVAFCILSAGIFRGNAPLDKIIEIAIRSIVTHSYTGLERVFFCAYAPHERVVTNEVFKLCAA